MTTPIDRPPSDRPPDDAPERARRSLRPLLALKPYLLKHPGMLGLMVVALVVSALATLAVPVAVRRVIDIGFAGRESAMIHQYFAVLIVIGLVLALASASRFFLVNWLGERVVADLRRDVFAHLVTLGPSFYDRTHSGEVMSRLTADTTQLKSAAGSSISQAARNLIMLIGALTMMLVTSVELSLLVLGAIPAIVLPLIAYGRVVRRLSRKAQDELAAASAYAGENLAAIRTLQAFTHEPAVSERFAGAVERSFTAARERLTARAGLTVIAMSLSIVSVVAILWYGAALAIAGEISGGRLSQFVLYAVFAAGALAELSEVWGEASQAAGAAERLTELLSARSDVPAPARPVALPARVRGDIAFDAVRFAYPSRPEAAALDGLTLKIAPGERVAIVGPSGAGKSTIFNLLLRFYDPTAGRITLDGIAIDTVDPIALRRQMALVPQEVALFADTVAENIRYGTSGADRAAVQRVAVAAQADGFIRELPQGYDTILGERGVTLSGGQRQRIAIARAVLKDAPILLLDEATSTLDAESESLVHKALDALKGRTTLVIAHRLATIQSADRIVVLDQGRIVETGTPQSLLRSGGLYARLAELQFSLDAAQ